MLNLSEPCFYLNVCYIGDHVCEQQLIILDYLNLSKTSYKTGLEKSNSDHKNKTLKNPKNFCVSKISVLILDSNPKGVLLEAKCAKNLFQQNRYSVFDNHMTHKESAYNHEVGINTKVL